MNSLQERITSHAENATREEYRRLPVDPVHKIEHTERVVLNTLAICQGDSIPLLQPVVAAWLHDWGRPAEHVARLKGAKLDHAKISAEQVPLILQPFRDSLGSNGIKEIQTAVAVHSLLNSPEDSWIAIILKDADRLDGLGSAGLYRTITAKYESPLYNPSNPFPDRKIERDNVTSQEITLAQAMLYTIEWFSMLRMPTAIRIGLSRVQRQIGFLEGLVEGLGLSRELLEQNEMMQEAKEAMQRIPNAIPFRI